MLLELDLLRKSQYPIWQFTASEKDACIFLDTNSIVSHQLIMHGVNENDGEDNNRTIATSRQRSGAGIVIAKKYTNKHPYQLSEEG